MSTPPSTLRAPHSAAPSPIISYLNLILEKAINDQASDIHFEPFEDTFRIRFRSNGLFYELPSPSQELASALISRIKLIANLNIAETRLPQDGRIQHAIHGRQVDLRVSTLPTAFGESVVLRVLDRSTVNLELESLGMPDFIYQQICQAITKPNGIFVVTGPTGSGKTTTLYSCLQKINTPASKILTAEDPVEYEIEGLMQVAINEMIGLTFAKALRAFLRHDPDYIMIGETRDFETAQIAIQASLTGHLVFTTLHTNDTTSTVTRLLDMGIEPFLLSASLDCILAQRLVRRTCPSCQIAANSKNKSLYRSMGAGETSNVEAIQNNNINAGTRVSAPTCSTTPMQLYCEHCANTGYKGRKALFELLTISDPLRELISSYPSATLLRQKAMELGMISLREHALQAINNGETTLEEASRYITID